MSPRTVDTVYRAVIEHRDSAGRMIRTDYRGPYDSPERARETVDRARSPYGFSTSHTVSGRVEGARPDWRPVGELDNPTPEPEANR